MSIGEQDEKPDQNPNRKPDGDEQSQAAQAAQTARSSSEIQADLQDTREHLAETVDALTHKLDVPARSREKAHALGRDHGRELAVGGAVVVALVVVVVLRRRGRR
ncbi:DUF3618 domain-containing protein [Nocardioides sp.]|uniref:DUF3618 domain-containing protein n=1 Tax=Nocardioides sp. TaxID=35761 RepID=UPI002B2722D5|nr:DUF3618 domain-containing protein [Nocardioides sp.]